MRIANFRDDLIWAVANQLGLNPRKNLNENRADALTSYVNAWARRVYPALDFPEWTYTLEFQPDSTTHIVGWDAVALVNGKSTPINRVFKVFLVDPATTPGIPVDTPFTERPEGIHCGYEHGPTVWIKFQLPPPRFTLIPWNANNRFNKGDITYSPSSGQCYKSKTSGNVGHDPIFEFSPQPGSGEQGPISLDTEIIASLGQGNPGMSAQDQIIDITFTSGGSSLSDIPNPPPLNARFFVEVVDVDGALVGNATSMANGTDTLDLIVTDLSNQLISALGGFTSVTVDTNTFTIRIEDDSNFRVNQAFWGAFAQPNRNVPVRQVQSYIAATGATDTTRQVIQFTLTDDQVTPGAVYQLTFKDVSGEDHIVTYTAVDSDGAQQVLSALISAMQSSAGSDPFFADVISQLVTGPASQHATTTRVSLNADMTLPGSAWWELVPLPMEIVDPLFRGVLSNCLKDEGQWDKGTAEEQAVTTELGIRSGVILAQDKDKLTTQQTETTRYGA